METVKQMIDSSLLNGIIVLPKEFQNKKVEITVILPEEKNEMPKLTAAEMKKMMKGSVTESLIGVLRKSDKSLDDYRAERLKKYERSD
jgi:hypothetical protein